MDKQLGLIGEQPQARNPSVPIASSSSISSPLYDNPRPGGNGFNDDFSSYVTTHLTAATPYCDPLPYDVRGQHPPPVYQAQNSQSEIPLPPLPRQEQWVDLIYQAQNSQSEFPLPPLPGREQWVDSSLHHDGAPALDIPQISAQDRGSLHHDGAPTLDMPQLRARDRYAPQAHNRQSEFEFPLPPLPGQDQWVGGSLHHHGAPVLDMPLRGGEKTRGERLFKVSFNF